ncbi:MAG: F0F1 ATP synthase subunit epsilon [Nocardioides sp.]
MSEKTLQVELVAADRLVWSGSATMVRARTAAGDVGVLADHAPLLSVLLAGVVEITQAGGTAVLAAVGDGFLSVANNRVSILADHADLATDIDQESAQATLDALQADGDSDADASSPRRLAEARLAAARRTS